MLTSFSDKAVEPRIVSVLDPFLRLPEVWRRLRRPEGVHIAAEPPAGALAGEVPRTPQCVRIVQWLPNEHPAAPVDGASGTDCLSVTVEVGSA